ncbi:putative calcineurin-like phosphoesterase [Lyophyllum shimeji]|uniref:Calcineurin-like phosphoesterase n=1 Tax=Lyophyllum shimeji TaxID=47721 RepID=A0A9P3PSL3_LYOSH|nr:putative calcineurin-like phosphoesterase [Lyophyllum shimeji]GLB42000.1 putative calcineurin-like phosphoesterase [Lyophyllum shimeji]
MAALPYSARHAPSPPRRTSSISSTNPLLSRRWPENGRNSIIAGNHDLTLHIDYHEWGHGRWHRDKQDVEQILELLTYRPTCTRGWPRVYTRLVSYVSNEAERTDIECLRTTMFTGVLQLRVQLSAGGGRSSRGEISKDQYPLPSTPTPTPTHYYHSSRRFTHGPPSGIFDPTCCGDLVGCEALRARLPSLRPRLHVFGHIHEARGPYVHAWAGDGAPASEPPEAQNEDGNDL